MVRKFVDIVKTNYLKKKQEKRAKSQKINPSAKVQAVAPNKLNLDQGRDVINISGIRDLHFHIRVKKAFNKLFVELFQLNEK